jgi:uncharacterized membrane protein
MTERGHLWAVGYDDMARAEQVREAITGLAKHCLNLLDTAVAVRYADGSVTLDGVPFVSASTIGGRGFAGFLAGLALAAPPLTAAAAGALVRGAGGVSAQDVIDEEFVSEVETLLKPGASALFVLDQEGDMDAILQGIRGLGGTILKTNVDLKRAKLIQSKLDGQ